ncbi:MAG: 1,4-dihydroxy-2-naphthoate polyprenyltransferase [Chitinophagales bacterium]|nr:1,4-dihydroxy-2-naphthoate polyprenyltransferase [Chitinophagales bacterium]MCZ2394693.1 1,4-dihydroxy-2-naphthoate polyprenyltransferase [Chitinophagales bacterium]
MASVSAWLEAFRLRTLPLSLSSIFLGSFLAKYHNHFQWSVLIGAVLTTLFLQILSNLANDYGDAVSGVDNQDRVGPQRGIQSGKISLREIKIAVIIFSLLSLVSGVLLLIVGSHGLQLKDLLVMLGIGIVAIWAAIKYTMGKNPYGYSGWGDIAVFLFFGWIGVLGTYFLHSHKITIDEFLPAISIGFFSAGVLNLNNLRDRENDKHFGKNTLVVKYGVQKAKYYHATILSLGIISALLYTLFNGSSPWKWVYILSFIGIIRSILIVLKNGNPALLDPELKKLAISTLIFSILFGIGLLV